MEIAEYIITGTAAVVSAIGTYLVQRRRQNIDALQRDRKQENTDFQLLIKSNESFRNEIKAELNETKQELRDAKQRINNLETELLQKSSEIEKYKSRIYNLESDLEESRQEIVKLQGRLKEIEK